MYVSFCDTIQHDMTSYCTQGYHFGWWSSRSAIWPSAFASPPPRLLPLPCRGMLMVRFEKCAMRLKIKGYSLWLKFFETCDRPALIWSHISTNLLISINFGPLETKEIPAQVTIVWKVCDPQSQNEHEVARVIFFLTEFQPDKVNHISHRIPSFILKV